MAMTHATGFTAHNVRLDDGSFTFPQATPIDQMGDYRCVKNLLPLLYPEGWEGRSIVDLGCLEGGFTTEFARLGLAATGIEVRQSNIANAEYIKAKTNLAKLHFIRDDAWNLAKYGPFDLVFCVGLYYHIENQRQFLHEMSRACRKAIVIDTHFAPEFDHEPAVALHNLSKLALHEGLPGRWYPEHNLDVAEARDELERLKWASWQNKHSFWPTRGALAHAMRGAGFSIVMESFDPVAGDDVRQLSPDGWAYQNCRSVFVGVKTADWHEPAIFDAPHHALDGSSRTVPPGGVSQTFDAERKALRDEIATSKAEIAAGMSQTFEAERKRLQDEIANSRAEIAAIHSSRSWKFTAPLRALRSALPGSHTAN